MRTALTSALLTAALACAPCGGSSGDGSPTPLDYVTDATYDRLVIEVDFVQGRAPGVKTVERLVEGLTPLIDKPGGIEVVIDEALEPVGGSYLWTFDELDALHEATTDYEVETGTVKMHTLFVDGGYDDGSDEGTVLGLAWGGDRITIFMRGIAELCLDGIPSGGGPLPNKVEMICRATEASVWTHEIGHLLGLVDNGLPMVHDHRDPDPDHGAHDVDEACVMHWANSRSTVVDRITAAIEEDGDDGSLGFGEDCLADLAAARGD